MVATIEPRTEARQATVWQIDPSHSLVEFGVKHMMFATVKGRFAGVRGRIDLNEADLGQSSARTFDLEVYAPGCDLWLEVSSVSWFTDYQARRANIRYRRGDDRKIEHVHTLNGSALAWSRIWPALVETGRRADGSIALPPALHPFFGDELLVRP